MSNIKKYKKRRSIGLIALLLGIVSIYIARYLNSGFGECVNSIGSIAGICRTPAGVNEFALSGIFLLLIGIIIAITNQIKITKSRKLLENH